MEEFVRIWDYEMGLSCSRSVILCPISLVHASRIDSYKMESDLTHSTDIVYAFACPAYQLKFYYLSLKEWQKLLHNKFIIKFRWHVRINLGAFLSIHRILNFKWRQWIFYEMNGARDIFSTLFVNNIVNINEFVYKCTLSCIQQFTLSYKIMFTIQSVDLNKKNSNKSWLKWPHALFRFYVRSLKGHQTHCSNISVAMLPWNLFAHIIAQLRSA